ncbi:MAG: hypothetical protein IPI34_02990 [bacterium]|nr:hypothetical protein [bacterium]
MPGSAPVIRTPPAAAFNVNVLRTVVDPVTGLPRAATAADLARGAGEHPYPQREAAGAEVVVHPDGMKSAVLDASFRSMSVAKIGPDGMVITGCVSSREEFDAFFAAGTAADGAEVR